MKHSSIILPLGAALAFTSCVHTGLPPAGIELKLGDRRAVLIGDTIPAGGHPEVDDAITIEGQTLYMVKLESRDPAAAVYVYQCRDRGPAQPGA